MLAFDIETTGLDPTHSVVTVVCTEDFHTGERRAYEFGRVRAGEPQNEARLREELIYRPSGLRCRGVPLRLQRRALRHPLPAQGPPAPAGDHGRLALQDHRHPRGGPPRPLRPDTHLRPEPALPAQPGARQVRQRAPGHQVRAGAPVGRAPAYCADDVRILCDLYRRRLLNNPRFHRVIDLRQDRACQRVPRVHRGEQRDPLPASARQRRGSRRRRRRSSISSRSSRSTPE
jgi:hypothetical protein